MTSQPETRDEQPEPDIDCEICSFGGAECDCWEWTDRGEPDRYCGSCAGTGWAIPAHCCVCGGSPYCLCCRTCGAACVGDCTCPITVQLEDGQELVL